MTQVHQTSYYINTSWIIKPGLIKYSNKQWWTSLAKSGSQTESLAARPEVWQKSGRCLADRQSGRQPNTRPIPTISDFIHQIKPKYDNAALAYLPIFHGHMVCFQRVK